ncbi:myelin basic protein [Tupaia chinensis]|uniref:myelin basic protein n=1 Tax=Tupaia chinensis TaxID=246437 RepID=UPI000FFB318D|nr:myelin basic protein [Tupaia chinensis]
MENSREVEGNRPHCDFSHLCPRRRHVGFPLVIMLCEVKFTRLPLPGEDRTAHLAQSDALGEVPVPGAEVGGQTRRMCEPGCSYPPGEADASQNNGTSSRDTAVTDSKSTGDPKNAWQDARPADPGRRPHSTRLFSRDAPGREDNTFKDRPSESDELQTIHEDTAAAPEGLDVMASQKRPSQRHGSKYLATAGTADHARPSFLPRHRDTGILDSIGRFFGGDRGAPKRGSGKDGARTTHYGSLPQKPQHGRSQDENPVVHFFKNIVTPRTPPPSQGKGRGLSLSRFSWGAEGQKPGFGYGGRASSAHRGFKGARDAQGTLSKIFKLGGRDSRSGSPMARR